MRRGPRGAFTGLTARGGWEARSARCSSRETFASVRGEARALERLVIAQANRSSVTTSLGAGERVQHGREPSLGLGVVQDVGSGAKPVLVLWAVGIETCHAAHELERLDHFVGHTRPPAT
jgi:hypothetical protein